VSQECPNAESLLGRMDMKGASRRVWDNLNKAPEWLGVRLNSISTPGWFVGSQVWKPALGLYPDPDSDCDFVVPDERTLDLFLESVMHRGQVAALATTSYSGWSTSFRDRRKFELTKLGGVRLYTQDPVTRQWDRPVLDVWTLPAGVSISEHIASFPRVHERFAFATKTPTELALLRAAIIPPTLVPDAGG
jgi:hypothetical protein